MTRQQYDAAKASAKDYWRDVVLPSIPNDGMEYVYQSFSAYWYDTEEEWTGESRETPLTQDMAVDAIFVHALRSLGKDRSIPDDVFMLVDQFIHRAWDHVDPLSYLAKCGGMAHWSTTEELVQEVLA